ncbi:hypothetical protein DFH09DRAFT_1309847 [Mycena vulgaris]|nr:hypothetical protein DFH09DRAFT_1309847 [Mycena vulgaris]
MQVALNFHGTSATLIGVIPNEYPLNATSAGYTIDGGAPVTFPLTGLPNATHPSHFNTILFTTPTLPDGPHNLTVIYGGDIDHTPLGVKQFYVTNTTSLASRTATQSAPTPTGTAGRRSKAGPIAGGVAAGVLMLALLAAEYFWLLRRKRRDTAELSASAYPVAMVDGARPLSQVARGHLGTSGSGRRNKRSGVIPPSTDTPVPSRRKGAPLLLDPVVLQHEDSGVRMTSRESSVAAPVIVELPPGYSPT